MVREWASGVKICRLDSYNKPIPQKPLKFNLPKAPEEVGVEEEDK